MLKVLASVLSACFLFIFCSGETGAETKRVSIHGETVGEDFIVRSSAVLGSEITTETVKPKRTYVAVTFKRTVGEFAGDNETPIFDVVLTYKSLTITCTPKRTYIWNSERAGTTTTVTAWCDRFVPFDKLSRYRSASISL